MNSQKYGSFKVYVDGEFLMTFRCCYGDVFALVWPIHFEYPMGDMEIVADGD